jgi:hypothetical protein
MIGHIEVGPAESGPADSGLRYIGSLDGKAPADPDLYIKRHLGKSLALPRFADIK